jgi:hypothetical protein
MASSSGIAVDSPRQDRLANMSGKLVAPRLVYRSACPVVIMPATGQRLGGAAAGLRKATTRLTSALADSAGTAGRAGIPPIPASPPA